MKYPKFQRVFNIRVVYKSGYTHDFKATQFKVATNMMGATTYSYVSNSSQNGPIDIGADDIAAVWQTGMRWQLTIA